MSLSWNKNLESLVKKSVNAHVEQQCRDGSVALHVDQTQAVWEVALSGPHEKQPGGQHHVGVISK